MKISCINGDCHSLIGSFTKIEGKHIYLLGVYQINGKIIKKGETATCGGVQIPVEAFGAWSTLRLYIQKIVYGG